MPVLLVDFGNIVKDLLTGSMRVFLIKTFPLVPNNFMVQIYVEFLSNSSKILD